MSITKIIVVAGALLMGASSMAMAQCNQFDSRGHSTDQCQTGGQNGSMPNQNGGGRTQEQR